MVVFSNFRRFDLYRIPLMFNNAGLVFSNRDDIGDSAVGLTNRIELLKWNIIKLDEINCHEPRELNFFSLAFFYLVMVLIGINDSFIQNFRLDTSGTILRVIAANFAFAERRSILNAVCSLMILYLVCSGRRTIGMTCDGFVNVLAEARTNFFEPILISDFVLSIRTTTVLIFGATGTFSTFTGLLKILVRVWILVSANGSATNGNDSWYIWADVCTKFSFACTIIGAELVAFVMAIPVPFPRNRGFI